jgi:hypothetical protein
MQTADKRVTTFTFSGDERIHELIRVLTLQSQQTNRSKVVREALYEKADRVLPADWRKRLGIEGEAA